MQNKTKTLRKIHPCFRHLPAQAASHLSRLPSINLKIAGLALALSAPILTADITSEFAKPPSKYRPAPLYWLNGKIENSVIDSQLAQFRDKDGYGSVAILPVTEYWEPEFIEKSGHILAKLDELGMWAIFCDDQSFPSGTAGGEIGKNYPEFCSRQINKAEQDETGPKDYQAEVPAGVLMGCVAMNNKDHAERIDITSGVSNGKLSWKVPAGKWKIMIFASRRDFAMNRKDPNINLDYLNPAAGDYEVSPKGFSGDALKFYKHAQRPLLDVIGAYGDKRDGDKLSGSAAFIYDKPILQCETYGAFEGWKEANFTPDLLYRTAMESVAKT